MWKEDKKDADMVNDSGGGDIWPMLMLATTVLVIITLCVFIKRFGSYKQDEAAVDGAYEMTVAPEVRDMAQELARYQEAALNSSVEIQINGEPKADAVTGRCNLMAGNPENNKRDLRIRVTLDETSEIIYQSPVIKPGERIAYVTLDRTLAPGEYGAIAEFAVLDSETGEAVGAVDAGVLLTVD